MYGILKATYNSRVAVCLGKLPVMCRNLFHIRCSFIRYVICVCSEIPSGAGIGQCRPNEGFVEG